MKKFLTTESGDCGACVRCMCAAHSSRIYKYTVEDKANVVYAVWGTELVQFLAALQRLVCTGLDEYSNRMN